MGVTKKTRYGCWIFTEGGGEEKNWVPIGKMSLDIYYIERK